MNTRTADEALRRCGHPRTVENTYDGHCRICRNASRRRRYAAKAPKADFGIPPTPRFGRVLDGSIPFDHRVRLHPNGRRDLCGICGLGVVELPKGMLAHAGGPLARRRSDVPPPRIARPDAARMTAPSSPCPVSHDPDQRRYSAAGHLECRTCRNESRRLSRARGRQGVGMVPLRRTGRPPMAVGMVAAIVEWFAQGLSLRAIGRVVGVSSTSVFRVLARGGLR